MEPTRKDLDAVLRFIDGYAVKVANRCGLDGDDLRDAGLQGLAYTVCRHRRHGLPNFPAYATLVVKSRMWDEARSLLQRNRRMVAFGVDPESGVPAEWEMVAAKKEFRYGLEEQEMVEAVTSGIPARDVRILLHYLRYGHFKKSVDAFGFTPHYCRRLMLDQVVPAIEANARRLGWVNEKGGT